MKIIDIDVKYILLFIMFASNSDLTYPYYDFTVSLHFAYV